MEQFQVRILLSHQSEHGNSLVPHRWKMCREVPQGQCQEHFVYSRLQCINEWVSGALFTFTQNLVLWSVRVIRKHRQTVGMGKWVAAKN